MFSDIIANFFFNKILVVSIDIIAIFLAYFVFKDNPKGKLNKIYLWMTALMMCWVNFAYIPRVIDVKYYNFGLLSLKIAWFVTPLFFVFIYLLSISLMEKENKYKNLTRVVILVGGLLAIITYFTNLIIFGFKIVGGVATIVYGSYKIPFLIGITFIIIAIMIPLFDRKNILQDKKIQYFIIGFTIFFVSNIVFNIILPMFLGISNLYFLGDYSILILLIFIAYAIARHSLFGIKIITTQFIVILFVSLLIINFLSSGSLGQYVWNGVLLFLSIFLGYLVIKNTLKDLERERGLRKKLAQKTGEMIKKMEDIIGK